LIFHSQIWNTRWTPKTQATTLGKPRAKLRSTFNLLSS